MHRLSSIVYFAILAGTDERRKKALLSSAFRLLTKKEKAWFFLLCGEQPKINELIFLIFCSATHDKTVFVRGLSSVSSSAFILTLAVSQGKTGSKRDIRNGSGHVALRCSACSSRARSCWKSSHRCWWKHEQTGHYRCKYRHGGP